MKCLNLWYWLRSRFHPMDALHYAIEHGPSFWTRWIACTDAWYAYYYARDVDRGSRDDTRKAACRDVQWAYYYAIHVDKVPRDDTRRAASRDPYWKTIYERDFPASGDEYESI